MKVPLDPPIFHITHINNLPSILREEGLWCDQQRLARDLTSTNIGHTHIKKRRLARQVQTRIGGMLGEYVPFNFCPRSVMLYAIARGHQDYTGGQENIVHLVSTVSQATTLNRAWAFSDRHAELAHALHFDDLKQLKEVNWKAMSAHYWTEVKEERQAEFLVHDFFPWSAISQIGVMTKSISEQVERILREADHRPLVAIERNWYSSRVQT